MVKRLQISVYNPAVFGDVVLIILGANTAEQKTVQKGNIVQILNDQNEVIGYNFFDVLAKLGLSTQTAGQFHLTAPQIQVLNQQLQAAGFTEQLVVDTTEYFVAGLVKEMTPHPDSDHLHVCQIELDQGQVEQIVCGAPNIAVNQKVAVAKVGAMMPAGQIIYPGVLRGVKSNGMVCSPRELALANAPQKRGILVLDDQVPTGSALDFEQLNQIFVK